MNVYHVAFVIAVVTLATLGALFGPGAFALGMLAWLCGLADGQDPARR